jgi:hypothetical protein
MIDEKEQINDRRKTINCLIHFGMEIHFATVKQDGSITGLLMYFSSHTTFCGRPIESQALIEKKYAGELDRDHAPCPKCGKTCKRRRADLKQIVSMQGLSALKRPWFYCVDCSYSFSPLDQVLELSRKKSQFDVQHKSTRTSAEVPFSGGSDLFAELTDQPVSDHFMHDTFEAVGAHATLADVFPAADQISLTPNTP